MLVLLIASLALTVVAGIVFVDLRARRQAPVPEVLDFTVTDGSFAARVKAQVGSVAVSYDAGVG